MKKQLSISSTLSILLAIIMLVLSVLYTTKSNAQEFNTDTNLISGITSVIATNSSEKTYYFDDGLTSGISTVIKQNSDMNNQAIIAMATTVAVGEAEEEEEFIFEPTMYDESKTMYTTSVLNIRLTPEEDDNVIGKLGYNDCISIVGEYQNWYAIYYNDELAYVYKDYVSEEDREARTYNYNWNGPTLNRSCGTIQGPSGKETYYNLDMSGVVRIMRARGFSEEEYPYWVRSDQVDMLGNYVICAADLNVHPRGSLVETSLGTGLVCDTGSFALSNPYQIDIAVEW